MCYRMNGWAMVTGNILLTGQFLHSLQPVLHARLSSEWDLHFTSSVYTPGMPTSIRRPNSLPQKRELGPVLPRSKPADLWTSLENLHKPLALGATG